MKTLVIAFCSIFITTFIFAEDPKSNTGKPLSESVLSADSVAIAFEFQAKVSDQVYFTDAAWLQRLSKILADATYKPESHCLCIAVPQIKLRRGSSEIGTLSVHHGYKLRVYIVGGVSGDFVVGEDVGRAVIDLVNEKKKKEANQSLEPTRMDDGRAI